MTADQTPNSLIKVNSLVTSKYGTAQILIFTGAGFSIIYLLQFIFNHKDNPDIINYGALAILGIIAAVYFGARSEYALFNSERFIVFNTERALKTNEIYKYSKKTTSKKMKKFTKLIGADDEGHLKFKICKTYGNNKCNFGYCYVVTPSDSRDLDSFHAGIARLYNSLPSNTIHKTVIAQSKDLADLTAYYAEKLKNKNLSLVVRAGLFAKMKFFEKTRERVGWMYVIFCGVGYYVDDEEGKHAIDEHRDDYSKFLRITGIKVKPVLNAEDYAILSAQMFTMKNLQGAV
jgi:hypothetical protein